MLLGRNSQDINDVETHPLANVSLSPTPVLSNNAITVRPSGAVTSVSAGPGTVHLNESALSPASTAALAALSLNSTTATAALKSTVPSVTTVRSPVATVSGSVTFAAPTSTPVAATDSQPPAVKAPVALTSSSSSSDMAVSKSSSSPSPTTHAPSTSTSKAHVSSSSVSPSKPSDPAPSPPPSTTVNSSTHSSATPLSTQRNEPSLTPSPNSSASSPPVGAPVTNTASQVHPASSVSAPSSITTSDFVPTSANGPQQSLTAHTSLPPSSPSKNPSTTTSHETTTNTAKGDTSSPAHTSSAALSAGKVPIVSNSSATASIPSSSSSSALSGGATIHSSEAISSNWDFFDNKKAVAGVFVVVGLALLAIISGSVLYCRRLRARRQRRSVAFQTISQPITTYRPTGSLHEGLMIDAERESSARHLMVSPSLRGSDVASVHRSASQSSHFSGDVHDTPGRAGIGALGLSGMRTHMDALPMGRQMTQVYRYDGPFSDYHRVAFQRQPDTSTIGMAISGGPETTPTVNKSRFSDDRAPSPAPSTPSIYPPSLPAQQDSDDSQFYEKEMRRPPSNIPVTRPLNLKVPQRVHFNELRRETSDAYDPFADPNPDSVDDLFYLETQAKVPPPRIDTRQLYRPGPLTPPDSTGGNSSATTPDATQSSDSDHDAKSNPFSAAFLGRPVVGKIEPWARPPRSPLRNPSLSSRLGK